MLSLSHDYKNNNYIFEKFNIRPPPVSFFFIYQD